MNTRTLALAIGIAIFVWIILWQPWQSAPPETDPTATQPLRPDFIAENLSSEFYAQSGTLVHKITASHLAHFSSLKRTELSHPKYEARLLEASENLGKRWEITAQTGILYDNEQLTLKEQVWVQNISGEGYVDTLETDFVSIDLQQQTLYSDSPVTIRGPQFTVKGVGFMLHIETQQLELQQHVETIFYPNQP